MKLFFTYTKILFTRNRLNYLNVALSIIITYILIAVTMVYMDNLLILSSDSMYSNMHYIYISIRTIFFIAGITFIISQYYNIMKTSFRDCCILRGLGATRCTIRFLIFIQASILMVISIPIASFTGFHLTGFILGFLGDFSLNQNTLEDIASTTTFFLVAGACCCIIILIGLNLERGIRKVPLSNILSDNSMMSKEG